jgi:PLP dependent protein
LTGEASKAGVEPAELPGWLERYPSIRGLMTMPPLADDPEASRPWFRRLRELADQHGLNQLSMGTSQDWRVAVEEGATLIRIGSSLFR